jgi:hypothetical protein
MTTVVVACAWCERVGVWSVEFDECQHVTSCCDDHYLEYFCGVGWEAYYESPDEFEAICPVCAG